jgi:hypothetical protein
MAYRTNLKAGCVSSPACGGLRIFAAAERGGCLRNGSQNFDEQTDANDDFGFFSTTCRRGIARPEENHQKSTNKLMETTVSFYFESLTGAASRAEQARDLRVSSKGT